MKTSVMEVRDMLSVLSVSGVEERIGKVPGVESPPRHNTCRLDRTKNLGAAKKDRSGTIRTDIQGPGSSTVVAA